MNRDRIARLALIASALALFGALAGAAAGVLGLFAFGVVDGDLLAGSDGAGIYGIAAIIGAAYGLVLGPAAVWFLRQNVPIWRAMVEPALAASAATAIVLSLGHDGLIWTVPAIAAVAAALRLRYARANPSGAPPPRRSN